MIALVRDILTNKLDESERAVTVVLTLLCRTLGCLSLSRLMLVHLSLLNTEPLMILLLLMLSFQKDPLGERHEPQQYSTGTVWLKYLRASVVYRLDELSD